MNGDAASAGTMADAAAPFILSRTLIADLETPVSAFLKIAHGRPYAFLLESVQGGARSCSMRTDTACRLPCA